MKRILAHKIRIKATDADKAFFVNCVGVARFAFNWADSYWTDTYLSGGFPNESELRRFLNSIKKDFFPWMCPRPLFSSR